MRMLESTFGERLKMLDGHSVIGAFVQRYFVRPVPDLTQPFSPDAPQSWRVYDLRN